MEGSIVQLCKIACGFAPPSTTALPFPGVYMTAERLPETQVMLQQLSDAREVLRSRATSVEPKEVHKLISTYINILTTCVASLSPCFDLSSAIMLAKEGPWK